MFLSAISTSRKRSCYRGTLSNSSTIATIGHPLGRLPLNTREKYIRFTQDEHMREADESHLKWKRIIRPDVNYARREGENREKFQTIMTLSEFNMKTEDIAKATRLTSEQVKAVIAAGDRGLDLLMGIVASVFQTGSKNPARKFRGRGILSPP